MGKVKIPTKFKQMTGGYHIDFSLLTFHCCAHVHGLDWTRCDKRGYKNIGCCCWSCRWCMIISTDVPSGDQEVVKAERETITKEQADSIKF